MRAIYFVIYYNCLKTSFNHLGTPIEINQYNLIVNQQIQSTPSSFNAPFSQQNVQQSSQSSIYDPQNVFASMRAGQIGPKIPPSNLSGIDGNF